MTITTTIGSLKLRCQKVQLQYLNSQVIHYLRGTCYLQVSVPCSYCNFLTVSAQSPFDMKTTSLANPQFQQATLISPGKDEFVGVLPTEEVEHAVAEQITVTENDLGHQTCQVITENLLNNLKGTPTTPFSRDSEFWQTSLGRFRFTIDQLPPQLQFVYSLLMNIHREIDPDVQYFLLNILKYLCLHCEALSTARREHRGFLIWLQENLLIPKLWGLLKSHYAQVGQLAVPLIIHAITLPCGEEVFWNVTNKDFTSSEWEVRFKAGKMIIVKVYCFS